MGLARIMTLLLLLFSAVVVGMTLVNTPAFNPRLISSTIVGEGRLPNSRFMYDLGQYEYQRGYGYLVSTDTSPGYNSIVAERASDGVLKYRAYQAADALEAAVSLDPGNARAWVALAWARARIEDYEGALQAARVSWKINPNNRTLATRRLDLMGFLTVPGMAQITLTDYDKSAVGRDIEVLSLLEPRTVAELEAAHPHLF